MFEHLITIRPLGLLYGSAGRFLSPENLVGRSGAQFPPSAATVSGLFAAQKGPDWMKRDDFYLAGPFWSFGEGPNSDPQNFCVPTPMNCLAKLYPHHEPTDIPEGEIKDRLAWHSEDPESLHWRDSSGQMPDEKFAKGTWVKIGDWSQLARGPANAAKGVSVYGDPWQYVPHLHPYLLPDERRVDTSRDRGSLFLENGVQMHPDTCLVYLSSSDIEDGWYRFGGEGHMVELTCQALNADNQQRFMAATAASTIQRSFALLTPAIWGSNRLSYRSPRNLRKGDPKRHELSEVDSDLQPQWQIDALLTERPSPYRYRLGDRVSREADDYQPHLPKRLSRGRYAVPAGSVYVLKTPLNQAWHQWDLNLFPKEGPSLKRWGCGLALPLESALAESSEATNLPPAAAISR
ncbi:MAG: type III-B CRISPR module-associated Cmr3 family protein [Cyanobacteria bacterium P01_D01_bin.115]